VSAAVAARAVGPALGAIVGPERLDAGGEACQRAAVDDLVPRWVVRPATLDQIAATLALAQDAGLAVVPRGSGSAGALGAPPAAVDLVLDLTGLDRVLAWHPDDLTVTVEAGCRAGALGARLHARRQWLALDPPGAAQRTLGGIVATNASGPRRVRYGTARDLLLGVRFVQADGIVTWGGARVVKSVTGYDVPKLMVGALGTLGVLVELVFRLHPVPDAEASWLATFTHAEPAQAFVARLLDSTVEPNRVEWLSGPALAAAGLGHAALGVAVSVGTVSEAVREQGERLAGFARATGGPLTALSDDVWASLERAQEADVGTVLRLSTLPSQLAATAQEADRAVAAALPGARARLTGCAAVGSLALLLPALEPAAAAGVVEHLRAFVAGFGGHVVIERGPRALRAAVDPWGPVGPGPLALMRALKAEFDPKRLLNPGRFVGGL
jgi:glycolate oxidase FAD binding subunit